MAGTYTTTARFLLSRLTGTSKVSDIDEGIGKLADDVDKKMVGYEEDTLAKRPAAGRPNAEFRATDDGSRYRDNGTTWDAVYTPGTNYSALTVRSAESSFTPSTQQRTFAMLSVACVGVCSGHIVVGGREFFFATEATTALLIPIIVAQGASWSWTKATGSITVQSSYHFF